MTTRLNALFLFSAVLGGAVGVTIMSLVHGYVRLLCASSIVLVISLWGAVVMYAKLNPKNRKPNR